MFCCRASDFFPPLLLRLDLFGVMEFVWHCYGHDVIMSFSLSPAVFRSQTHAKIFLCDITWFYYFHFASERPKGNKWIMNDTLDGLHANFIHLFDATLYLPLHIFFLPRSVNLNQSAVWGECKSKRTPNSKCALRKYIHLRRIFMLVFIASNTH